MPILGWYRFNMGRVRMLIVVPAQAAALAMDMRGWLDMAELETTGSLGGDPRSKEMKEKVEARMTTLSYEHTMETAKLQGTPAWDAFVRERIDGGMAAVNLMASASAAQAGLDALLASMVTGTWTAFEAMAVDLWEAAVNFCPAKLANLNGRPADRFGKDKDKGKPETRRAESDEGKSVRLDLLQEYGFDIREKMGTILRRKFDFGRLRGIQTAYGSAFDTDADAIDKVLQSPALDALSTVRNLLVHKANVVDAEYLRRAKSLPVPIEKLSNRIVLDGETIVKLIEPAMNCGAELITAVDDWLDKHK